MIDIGVNFNIIVYPYLILVTITRFQFVILSIPYEYPI